MKKFQSTEKNAEKCPYDTTGQREVGSITCTSCKYCLRYNEEYSEEKDPHRVMTVECTFDEMQGRKNDRQDHKVRMELLPLRELYEIAKVYTAGAEKYGDNLWQHLENGAQRYKGALLRHLVEAETKDRDEDTGCLHLAQVAWNAIAILHFKLNEIENNKVENNKTK